MAALLGVGAAPSSAENWSWSRPVPVSRVASSCETWIFGDLVRGPGSDFSLHALLAQRERRFSERLFHLRIGRDLDWNAAWQARELFTFESGSGSIAFVPTMVVDSRDRVHAISEVFNAEPTEAIHIGYKTDAWPHWDRRALPVLLDDTGTTCRAANPGATLARDADGVEWLHVVYHRRPGPQAASNGCRPFWYVHDAKPLSVPDPDRGWVGETWLTGFFAEQEYRLPGEGGTALAPIVDSQGKLHVIGRRKLAREDSVWVCHLSGTPPGAGGAWDLSCAAIDSMPLGRSAPGTAAEPVVWVTKQAELAGSGGDERLDLVWSHNFVGAGKLRKEVWFAELSVASGSWSRPVQVTPQDATASEGARLQHSRDGSVHVMYHEPMAQDSTSSIFYVRARGDPRVQTNWSGPVPLTDDVRGRAYRPVFVAENDTVWVGYTRADDVTGETRAWFRRGHALGTQTEGDETWDGMVWLDSDFTVREGHTLTIRPGTRVIRASSSRVDRTGYRAQEVDLVVEGRVLALGEVDDWIRFASRGSRENDAAREWVHLESAGSRFEYCSR